MQSVLYFVGSGRVLKSHCQFLEPKEHLLNHEIHIFCPVFDLLSLVLKRKVSVTCPWCESTDHTEFHQRLLASPFISPCSCDGVSFWPEGSCGHDVHWHTNGLLSGRSLCAHTQVSCSWFRRICAEWDLGSKGNGLNASASKELTVLPRRYDHKTLV